MCIKKQISKPFDSIYLKLGGFLTGVIQSTSSKINNTCQQKQAPYGLILKQKDRFAVVLDDQIIKIQTKSQKIEIHPNDIYSIKSKNHIFEVKTKSKTYLGFILNKQLSFYTPFEKQTININSMQSYYMPFKQKERIFMELSNFRDPIFSNIFFLKKAGQFKMGRDTKVPIFLDESPAHMVNISTDFYASQTELSVEDWIKIMPNNNFTLQDDCLKCPMSNANWNQVDNFINKLNTMQDLVTYSLPTEAEWEYIAKNYTKEDKTPINEFNKVCEYQKINLFCDLFSGVWEWTKDNKSKYLKKLQTDPIIISDSNRKVYRGGSNFSQNKVRNHTYRGSASKTKNDHTIGFRLILRKRK